MSAFRAHAARLLARLSSRGTETQVKWTHRFSKSRTGATLLRLRKPLLATSVTVGVAAWCWWRDYPAEPTTQLPLPPWVSMQIRVVRELPPAFQTVVATSVALVCLRKFPSCNRWTDRYMMTSLANVVGRRMYWTLPTSALLHSGSVHMGLNMLGFAGVSWMVIQVLPALADPLTAVGSFIFASSASAGAQLLVLRYMGLGRVQLCGLSGCVYGLITLMALSMPRERLQIIFLPSVGTEARFFWPCILAIDAGLLFLQLRRGMGGKSIQVAHAAHLGGAFAGLVLYPVLHEASARKAAGQIKPFHDGLVLGSQKKPGSVPTQLLLHADMSLAPLYGHLFFEESGMKQMLRDLHMPPAPGQPSSDVISRALWRARLCELMSDWAFVKQVLEEHKTSAHVTTTDDSPHPTTTHP